MSFDVDAHRARTRLILRTPSWAPFQRRARRVVLDVLAKHGHDPAFVDAMDAAGRPWAKAEFTWQDRLHEIEIFVDSIVMTSGNQLFEPYLRREFVDDAAQIAGFAERLDRYLSGGSWAGPDEEGPVERLWRRFRSLLGSFVGPTLV